MWLGSTCDSSTDNLELSDIRKQLEVETQDNEKLRQENMQLPNVLGQAQQKITHLEETVKMLEAPKEEKKQNGGGFSQ